MSIRITCINKEEGHHIDPPRGDNKPQVGEAHFPAGQVVSIMLRCGDSAKCQSDQRTADIHAQTFRSLKRAKVPIELKLYVEEDCFHACRNGIANSCGVLGRQCGAKFSEFAGREGELIASV
jgi:hypothetical protein